MEYRREVVLRLEPLPEAAWVFTSAAHGQGYAYEAAAAAHRWMDETHAPPATQCIISPANRESLRLAGKLGYHLHDEQRYRDQTVHRLIRTRP